MECASHQLLQKFTIVIISKERTRELSLSLDYWARTGCNIVVVHDSQVPLTHNYPNNNFIYLNSNQDYLTRLGLASNFISTEYSAICNDDEIFLLNPIIKFISYLDTNRSLESIGGQVMSYDWAGSVLLGQKIYPFLQDYSNVSEDSLSRIKKTFDSKNMMDLTLIYRSEKLKHILKICAEFNEFNNPVMGEVMFAFFSSYFCRSVRFNDVYWFRNWFTPYHNSKIWNRETHWYDWCNESKFHQEVADWTIKFRNILTKHTIFTEQEKDYLIRYLLSWKSNQNKKKVSFIENKKYRIKEMVKYCIPDGFSWKLKNYFPNLRVGLMDKMENVLNKQEECYRTSTKDLENFKLFVLSQKELY